MNRKEYMRRTKAFHREAGGAAEFYLIRCGDPNLLTGIATNDPASRRFGHAIINFLVEVPKAKTPPLCLTCDYIFKVPCYPPAAFLFAMPFMTDWKNVEAHTVLSPICVTCAERMSDSEITNVALKYWQPSAQTINPREN